MTNSPEFFTVDRAKARFEEQSEFDASLSNIVGSLQSGNNFKDPKDSTPLVKQGVLTDIDISELCSEPVAAQTDDKPDPKKLIERLGDDEFEIRYAARKELMKMGMEAKPFMVDALKNNPSAEVKMQLEMLLKWNNDKSYERAFREASQRAQMNIDENKNLSNEAKIVGKKLIDTLAKGNMDDLIHCLKENARIVQTNKTAYATALRQMGISMEYVEGPESLGGGELSLTSSARKEGEGYRLYFRLQSDTDGNQCYFKRGYYGKTEIKDTNGIEGYIEALRRNALWLVEP